MTDQPTIEIRPREGLRVRKLNGHLLDPAGESVTWDSYWRRRELDGDIERVPEKTTKASRKAAQPVSE